MGVEAPETCWATHKHQVINLWNYCILLVELFESYDDARTYKRQTTVYFLETHDNKLQYKNKDICIALSQGFLYGMNSILKGIFLAICWVYLAGTKNFFKICDGKFRYSATKYSVIGLRLPIVSEVQNALIREMSRNTNLATNRHIADDLNCQKPQWETILDV